MSEQQNLTVPQQAAVVAPQAAQAPQLAKVQKSVRQRVMEAFESVEMQSALTMLPPWIDPRQFAALAAAELSTADIGGCNMLDIVRQMLKVAEWGMLPGACKHVYITPRKVYDRDTKAVIGLELEVAPQWQGIKYVFGQGGWDVSAHVVCNDDEFEYDATGPDEFVVTKHRYDPLARVVKKENLRGAYGICRNLLTGEIRYFFVEKERVERAFTAAKTKNIWGSDFKQMVMKTIYHQISNRNALPMAPEVQALMQRIGSEEYAQAIAVAPAERRPLTIGVVTPLQLTSEPDAEVSSDDQ